MLSFNRQGRQDHQVIKQRTLAFLALQPLRLKPSSPAPTAASSPCHESVRGRTSSGARVRATSRRSPATSATSTSRRSPSFPHRRRPRHDRKPSQPSCAFNLRRWCSSVPSPAANSSSRHPKIAPRSACASE